MNYSKLIDLNPTSFGVITNSKGQQIEFVEHPRLGDEFPIICVCHELKLAESSDFFDLDDMTADHKEYEPWFNENNKLEFGIQIPVITLHYKHAKPTGIIQFEIDKVIKVYHGKGRACRCGCLGEYTTLEQNRELIQQVLDLMASQKYEVTCFAWDIYEILIDEEKDLVYTIYLKK